MASVTSVLSLQCKRREYLLLPLTPLLPDLATTLGPLQLSLIPCDHHHSSIFACTYSDFLYHEPSVYQVLAVL